MSTWRSSAKRIALVAVVPVVLAACSGLPCRPQSYYAAPEGAPYRAVEARVPTSAGHTLVGTLTLPLGGTGPLPAVVLISGSHAQDRDMVGSLDAPVSLYRPFRQIADDLGRRGIAVLRLDDRDTACSVGGSFPDASTADRSDDSRAALAYLRGREEIDRRRLGLIGISEGANIAVMIAATDHDIGGIVTMGASAAPGGQVWAHQTRYLISLGEEMDRAKKARWLAGEDPDVILSERVAEARAHVARGEANAWWTFFFDFDPSTVAHTITSPVLILHGDRDSNVPVAHARKLAEAIRAGGNADVTVRIFRDHDHLFLPDEDGGFRQYGRVLARTHLLPNEVLDTISDWLVDRLAADAEG